MVLRGQERTLVVQRGSVNTDKEAWKHVSRSLQSIGHQSEALLRVLVS